MSLDVSLYRTEVIATFRFNDLMSRREVECNGEAVYIRYDMPTDTIVLSRDTEVYSANITHNLSQMAAEAMLHIPLWRPDEVGMIQAGQLIGPIEAGLALLRSDPQRFSVFNPENGWGSYDGLVSFASRYLAACREYPDAAIYVSR